MVRHLVHFGLGVGSPARLHGPGPGADPPAKAAAPPRRRRRLPARRRLPPVLQEAGNHRGLLARRCSTKSRSAASTSPPACCTPCWPSQPTEEELVGLEDKYGMAAFLTLRTVDWSNDPKVAEQATKDADQLIDLVREAVKKKLNDPKRFSSTSRTSTATGGTRLRPQGALPFRRPGRAVPDRRAATGDPTGGSAGRCSTPCAGWGRRRCRRCTPPWTATFPALQLDILDVLRSAGRPAPCRSCGG